MLQSIVDTLLEEGALGVIILGLGLWCWKLQKRLDRVQDKRVQDAMKITEVALTSADALDRNTETLKALAGD